MSTKMTVILMITLVFTVGVAGLSEAQTLPSCATSLAPCVYYVNSTAKSTNPPDTCCQSLRNIVSNFTCLCGLYYTSDALEASGINFTQIIELNPLCGFSGDFSNSRCAGTDTLSQAGTLNSHQYLISAGRVFTLGFFKPNYNDNSYLAIWFAHNSSKPVWIANRDKPIVNDSGILTIDSKGRFVINRIGGDPIELYPGENIGSVTNTSATLFDNGNLVLSILNSDGSIGRTLWQSFDYPTDTLLPGKEYFDPGITSNFLPGMKLGFNNRTGMKWSLTSWFAADDPSSGPFTLEWDPEELQLVVRQRGAIFWTSGAFNEVNETFEHLQKLRELFLRNGIEFALAEDSYMYIYRFIDGSEYNGEIGFQITYEGDILLDNETILVHDCYGYNAAEGCAEWTRPQCRYGNTTFELISGSFLGSNGEVISGFLNKSASPADCRVNCWNDCDCLGYHMANWRYCEMYSRGLRFELDLSGASTLMYVIQGNSSSSRPSALAPPQAKRKKWIWIAIMVPSTLLTLIVMVIVFYISRKNKGKGVKGGKENYVHHLMTTNRLPNENELDYGENFAQNLKIFSFVSIIEATNNFSPERKLGEGGFGPVYKGESAEHSEIAIKRLSRSSGQGLEEFKNELVLIAKLQHRNLVRLLGYCIQGEEKILVYEFMPNKSLDSFLFDPSKRGLLNWRKRLMIIEGIAQGLIYLHQHSRLKIIHRDLKASNILLDANMNPKISDFGMARIFSRNELMANTHRIVGTYGYMSPEYAFQGIFSVKSDVFSFGVLILEVISGRRNNSFYDISRPLSLIGYAWELWQRGAGLELMDPILTDSCPTHLLLRLIHVGLLCVEDSPTDRPTISQVISMVTNENILLPLVKKPAFLNLESATNDEYKGNKLECPSINEVSISSINAR